MKKNLDNNEKDSNFAPQKGHGYHVSLILKHDSVAQLVEQMTLNHWVVGSSPTGVTYKDHRKWKIAENQTFSAIFILSKSPEIGKI